MKTNKELAIEFVKNYPHMALSLASSDNAEEFWIKKVEELLDKVEQRNIDILCDGLYKKYKYNEWEKITHA